MGEPGRTASVVSLGRYADAEEALRRLRADLDAAAGRSMPAQLSKAVAVATRRDAATLGSIVLDPVAHLVGYRELVIVPTGTLAIVP